MHTYIHTYIRSDWEDNLVNSELKHINTYIHTYVRSDWEDNLVNSELKWRFNLTHSDQGSPWGAGGALLPLSVSVKYL